MGLLAPLYALAALAIAAPILFHLIRRQPKGQSEFSSLMFLQPSPPRLTRRSRLDNLLLLLLRALALILIALAFARPFLRSSELAEARVSARNILLLVDTSGSMQRKDVWNKAIQSATEYVASLGEEDQVGLATFDTKLNMLLALPEPSASESGSARATQSAVSRQLEQLKPSYRGTRLADCLMAAIESLQEQANRQSASQESQREIVLVSDLHESSGLEALQGFAWPENVRLDIRRVTPDAVGNARANIMQPSASSAGEEAATSSSNQASSNQASSESGNVLRVRVENNKNSDKVDFQLKWLDSVPTNPSGSVVHIQVPPGQARVVPVPFPTASAARLELSGDHAVHDNVVDVPRTAPRRERIGFIGQLRDKPEEDLFFFLSQVPLSTPVRHVEFERLTAAQVSGADADQSLAGLVIEWPAGPDAVRSIEPFVQAGKPVVVVMARPVSAADAQASDVEGNSQISSLSKLLGFDRPVSLREAAERNFALLGDIDFRHPLFQPLADAKFNDFGKVRFWAHRELQLADDSDTEQSGVRVVARFDDKSPAIINRRIGRGELWLLTAGWQATASQLALSSKFVPLVFGMLDPQGRSLESDAIYEVGEAIDIPAGSVSDITRLDGSLVEEHRVPGKLIVDEPGLYWLEEDGKRRQIAIVLPQSESQLDALDIDRFQQYGVVTGKSDSAQERKAAARLSQINELEGRQKLWRWILVGAACILLAETLLAAKPPVT